MANPFQSLKYLPWAPLFQSAAVTVFITALIEYLLFELVTFLNGLSLSATGDRTIAVLFGAILPIALAVGIGALALIITDRLFQQIPLRRDTMWALVACVAILLPIKNLLIAAIARPNPLGIGLGVAPIVLIAVGLFTTGRRYWRY